MVRARSIHFIRIYFLCGGLVRKRIYLLFHLVIRQLFRMGFHAKAWKMLFFLDFLTFRGLFGIFITLRIGEPARSL